jgi:hypothetical protein
MPWRAGYIVIGGVAVIAAVGLIGWHFFGGRGEVLLCGIVRHLCARSREIPYSSNWGRGGTRVRENRLSATKPRRARVDYKLSKG